MKVSKAWLSELVDLKVSLKEVERLLPLRTIATKEITDDFIELDMKGYNRADLLSMRGVAREVAAITDSVINFKDPEGFDKADLPEISVKIENNQLCPLYCIAKIDGLKIAPSASDWVKKLSDSGMRSINNVADITNLIMLEYGQPLHAFNASNVVNQTIIVRNAKPGEKLTTLDGKVRDLTTEDLLIADPEKPLGIAGVMGGKDSEIPDNGEVTILLEAAIFDPISIRKTAQRHNLPSEASKRFQHGLTKTNLLQALSAAIKMYQDLGGQLTGLTIIGDTRDQIKTVKLTPKKVNSLIGVEIKPEDVESYLEKLQFSLTNIGDSWEVTVPYFRLDINIEEDLIEEVARMYGYEKIPAKELAGDLPEKIDQSLFENIYNLKKTLADLGLTEVQSYSFFSTDILSALQIPTSNLIKVANPMSAETEYLRNELWPNLVEVVGKNLKQGFEDIAIFEIGKVYEPEENNRPKESFKLSLILMNDTGSPIEELTVILRRLAEESLTDVSFSDIKSEILHFVQDDKLFHPTRVASMKQDEKEVGFIAEVHPRILNEFGIQKRVAILEINLEELFSRH